MKTNLYTVTVPIFKKHLMALSGLLEKAEAHMAGDAGALATLTADRLYEDMFPFGKQIEVACDNAKLGAARLSGKEAPKFEDGDYAIETLRDRIANTVAFLDTLTEGDFAQAEEVLVELPYFAGKKMNGFGYASEYVIPNFFFHLVTAYAILRKNGVPIGKMDYMTSLPFLEDVA